MAQNFVVMRDEGVVPAGARVRFATGQGRGRGGTPRGQARGGRGMGGGRGEPGPVRELGVGLNITLMFNVSGASKWDITRALAPME